MPVKLKKIHIFFYCNCKDKYYIILEQFQYFKK
nr:MAG TPA: hypothetical protein [Caudoviricetes sp.]